MKKLMCLAQKFRNYPVGLGESIKTLGRGSDVVRFVF